MLQLQQSDRRRYGQYYFIYFIGAGAFYPFIALYFKAFGFSETQIGLILSAAPVVSMFAQPMWGMVNDYFNKEKIMVGILSILTAVTLFLLTISRGNFFGVLGLYLMFTLFICGVLPIVDKMVTNFCIDCGDIKFGQIRIWGSIAWGISSFVTGKVIGFLGLNLIVYVFMSFLIGSILLFVFMPKKKQVTSLPKPSLSLTDITSLRKNKLYIGFVVFWFLYQMAVLGSHAYFSLYLVELGGNADHVGFATMLGIVAEAPALLYFSRNSEKFGELKLMIFAVIIASVRLFMQMMFPTVPTLIAMFFLNGIAQGIFIGMTSVYIMKVVVPSVQTTALTLFVAVTSGVGNFLGTMLFGMFVEKGGYSLAYFVMLVPLLVAFGVLIYVAKIMKEAEVRMELVEC